MKKILSLFLLVLLLISCTNNKTYYNVTLDYGEVEVIKVEENTYLNTDINPEKEGYTFGGWYKDSTYTLPFVLDENRINQDITIYGKFNPNSYNIILHYNNDCDDLNINAFYNDLLDIEEPIKDGYIFCGWYLDASFNNFFDISKEQVKSDLELYAKWSIKPYEVTFIVDGESSVIYVDPNETCSVIDNPTKDGYTFSGWYYNDVLFDFNTIITSDIVLVAKFKRNEISYNDLDSNTKKLLSGDGFLDNKITDFTSYVDTLAYVKVSTPLEFGKALLQAKYNYTNTWNEDTKTVSQTLIEEGKVHVIEITNDLNLGYNVLTSEEKALNIFTDYKTNGALSNMVLTNGISQIKVENISNLLIFSKNGSKITHAGFKVTSCHNVVFRNLEMDEIWEWEDSFSSDTAKIGDYDKFGWAYFKISHCGQIWIDHMTFGKSYDGQIDYANPVSNSKSTKIRLAYGSDGSNGLHISYCNFMGGSDDKDGYLYQMMKEIDDLYNSGKSNYLYYNALRDSGLSFNDILYGVAIPQKKGFLFGDNSSSNDDFYYNKEMKVSFNSCKIINFCDRIPKVRGGQVFMYNTLIDSLKYLEYRSNVYAYGSSVAKVNSTWKCACVSQGFLVSYGGYLHIENSIIRGVNTLIKNNDTKVDSFVENIGYYNFINISYQPEANKKVITGSTTNNVPIQFKKEDNNLKISSLWPYYNGSYPFEVNLVSLDSLEEHLNNLDYGVGVKSHVTSWLISILKS